MPALGPSAHDAAAHLVGELGRGQVEDALKLAVPHEVLHRAPAGTGGVKDQHLHAGPLQPRPGPIDRGGRVAEHRCADQWLVVRLDWSLSLHHAGDRRRRIRIDPAADPVEAGHVEDGWHEGDVFRPGVGCDVATAHGGDHQLRHADG